MLFDVVKHPVVVVRHHGNLHDHYFFAGREVGHEFFVDLQIGILKTRVDAVFRYLIGATRRGLGCFGFFVEFVDFFMRGCLALVLEKAGELKG